MELFSKAGDVSGITILLDDASQLARVKRLVLRSLRLASAASALEAVSGVQIATLANFVGGRPVASDAEDERNAWAEGQAMSTEDAVRYAMSPESET